MPSSSMVLFKIDEDSYKFDKGLYKIDKDLYKIDKDFDSDSKWKQMRRLSFCYRI